MRVFARNAKIFKFLGLKNVLKASIDNMRNDYFLKNKARLSAMCTCVWILTKTGFKVRNFAREARKIVLFFRA